MARTSVSLTDDDLIPGVDKAIKDLERAIVLVNKLSEYKSFGLDFKTPPAIIKKNLQEINKELKLTLDSAPRTYSQLGRSIDRMNAEIRTKMAQARNEVAKTSQAVKKASAEGAQAVTGLGNAAKVAASAAAAGKAVPNAKVTQAAKAVDKASETIQREADATARVARETSVKLREQLRTGPARNGAAPAGVPGLGNLTGAQAGYAAILMQDQKLLKPLHDLKAAAKQLGIKKKELELLLRSQNTAVYKAINEHTNGLIGASNQVRGFVGPGSIGAGGKPPTRRFGGVGHSLARGVSAAGGALFLTYGSAVPAVAGAYAGSMAVKKSVGNFAELDQQLRFSQAVAEDYSVSVKRSMEAVLATSKKFARSQTEVAGAVHALTQAGVSAQQALTMVDTVMSLAVAGEMDAKAAAVTLAGSTQAFGYSFSESARVADVFAKAAAVSSSSVEDITQAMKQASTVAKGYGITVEQVGVAMAALGKQNIVGSAAGTAFRNLIMEVTNPTRKAQEEMNKLGLTFFDKMTGKPKDLIGEFIPELKRELDKLDNEGQAKAIGNLFNNRSRRLVEVLVRMSEKELKELTQAMQNARGYAAEVAYIKNDNLMGQWKKLVQEVNAAFTTAGARTENGLIETIRNLRDVVTSDGFQSGLNALLSGINGLVVGFTTFAGAARAIVSNLMDVGRAFTLVARDIGKWTGFSDPLKKLGDDALYAKNAMEGLRNVKDMQKDLQAQIDQEIADKKARLQDVKEGPGAANVSILDKKIKDAEHALNAASFKRRQMQDLLERQSDADRRKNEISTPFGGYGDAASTTTYQTRNYLWEDDSVALKRDLEHAKIREEHARKALQEAKAAREKYKASLKESDELGKQITAAENLNKGITPESVAATAIKQLAEEEGRHGSGTYEAQKASQRVAFVIAPGGRMSQVHAPPSAKDAVQTYVKPYDGNFRISAPLGERRVRDGKVYYHKGVDVAMPVGTPLKAMMDGTVLKTAYNEGAAGNLVKIQHTDGTIAKYFHMQGFAQGIKAGQMVRAGQVIGTSGNTGRSTGPHLHMEVWRNGKPEDFQKWVGRPRGVFQGNANVPGAGVVVSAENADALLGKVNDHYSHLQKGIEVNLEKAKLRLDAMFDAGDIITRDDYNTRLAKLQADAEQSIAQLELQRAGTLKQLADLPGITEDGRRSITQDMIEAGHNAERRGLSAQSVLRDAEPWRQRLDSIREAIQGYDELAIGIRRSLEAAREEDEFSLRVGRMDEQDAAVATAKREATARYREELERIKAVIEYLESKGADRTPEGQKVISAWTDKAKQLESDMGQAGDKAGELEFQKLMQRRGKDMSRSFTAALTGGNAKEDIRNWIIEEVLAKPFKMKIEMLMQPLMELIAGQLFGMNNGKGGGLGGGGLLGNLINAGVGALLGAFAPKAPAPTGAGLTGSFTPAPQMGGYYSMPRFANGGIMTQDGPLPLRMYSNGGVANSPQLALYGEGSRPEAYVPLPDGRSIPVTMRGGNAAQMSSSVNITINNHSDGSSDSKSEGMGSGGQMDWSRQLAALVQQEMVKQMRPGGLYSQATEQ